VEANTLSTFPNDTPKNLLGVEKAFESMLDDMLMGFSGAQLMITPGGNHTAPVNATVAAVVIGEGTYIYAIMALNFLFVGIFVIETTRTRGWSQLKKFDYNNLSSLVVAKVNGREGAVLDRKGDKDTRMDVLGMIADPTDKVAIEKLQVTLVKDGSALVVGRRDGSSIFGTNAPANYSEFTEDGYESSIPLVQQQHPPAWNLS
jgi:hypothetical protein